MVASNTVERVCVIHTHAWGLLQTDILKTGTWIESLAESKQEPSLAQRATQCS